MVAVGAALYVADTPPTAADRLGPPVAEPPTAAASGVAVEPPRPGPPDAGFIVIAPPPFPDAAIAPPDAAPAADAAVTPPQPRAPEDTAPPPRVVGKGELVITVKGGVFARVFLNGRAIGEVPLKVKVAAGRHTVTLENETKKEKFRVEIKAGETKRIEPKW